MSQFVSIPEFSHGFRGAIAHASSLEELHLLDDGVLLVDADGKIVLTCEARSEQGKAILSDSKSEIHQLKQSEVLIPGFVDLHIHAPQWPQMGKALHLPLEDWLQQYTFPLEARYSDIEFAKRSYADLVDTLLANGTTTGLYFGTIHNEATLLLAQICFEKGQRALIGRLAMDNHDQCPDFYRDETTADALDGTQRFVEDVRAMPGNEAAQVKPVVTPRFIPSCTDDCLSGLAEIASETGAHIQNHGSESDWEHNYVLDRHGKTDTESMQDIGLLGRHTILAHGNFISSSDMDVLKVHGAAVAHCPLSNIYFSNAVFPLRAALEKGVHVGLGTDISGGPSPSLLENARQSVHVSRMLEEGTNPDLSPEERGKANARIDFKTAFYLATRGGGIALDLPIGSFETGHHFDALIVDMDAADSNVCGVKTSETEAALDEKLQKIIFNAGRQNITAVYVSGKQVSGHQ